jgi:hypothetical protein
VLLRLARGVRQPVAELGALLRNGALFALLVCVSLLRKFVLIAELRVVIP